LAESSLGGTQWNLLYWPPLLHWEGRLDLTLASASLKCPGTPNRGPGSLSRSLPHSCRWEGWERTQGHLGLPPHSPVLFPLEVAPGPHGSQGLGMVFNPSFGCYEIRRDTLQLLKGLDPSSGKSKVRTLTPWTWPSTSPACLSCPEVRSPRGLQHGQK
jgi:hypothetical protein